MIVETPALTQRSAWWALAAQHEQLRNVYLRQLFADDPQRGERLVAEGAGLYLDYSKQRITDETLASLVQLADQRELRRKVDFVFRGEKVNLTEERAALHIALRAPRRVDCRRR
jgi:glucose-6-phosphate isomerase